MPKKCGKDFFAGYADFLNNMSDEEWDDFGKEDPFPHFAQVVKTMGMSAAEKFFQAQGMSDIEFNQRLNEMV